VRNLGDFEKVYREIDEGESFLIRLQSPDNQTNITALTKPS
jgi:hypothetical protein